RLFNLERLARSVKHNAMAIENIPAQKDERFLRMSQDLHDNRRQVTQARLQAICGQQEHLASKTADRQFVQRDQSQPLSLNTEPQRAQRRKPSQSLERTEPARRESDAFPADRPNSFFGFLLCVLGVSVVRNPG